MKRFIYAERSGVHIFDLTKTLTQLQVACGFVHDVVLSRGAVLFVGTKKQAQQDLREAAQRTRMPYVVDRWLGGTLTNLRTIRNSVNRMKQIDRLLESPEGQHLPKKEQSSLRREQGKLHRNLDGIRELERPPAAMFVVDLLREHIAVHEAQRLNIPIIAIVDTNCDPDQATYPIAGNDDAIRSVKIVTKAITDAIAEAQAELGSKAPAPAPAETAAAPAEPAPVPAAAPVAVAPAAPAAPVQPPATV